MLRDDGTFYIDDRMLSEMTPEEIDKLDIKEPSEERKREVCRRWYNGLCVIKGAVLEYFGVGSKYLDVWLCALLLGLQGRNYESPAVLVVSQCRHDQRVPRYFCQLQNTGPSFSSQYLFGGLPIAPQRCRVGAQ